MTTGDPLPDWANTMNSPLDAKMGLELSKVTPEETCGSYPVEGNTQPLGLWHGGASCVCAESLASIAAMAHAARLGKVAVGLDINATHHRSVRSGRVHGTARALHLGRNTASYEVTIVDDDGRRVCTARMTAFVRDRVAADKEL